MRVGEHHIVSELGLKFEGVPEGTDQLSGSKFIRDTDIACQCDALFLDSGLDRCTRLVESWSGLTVDIR